MDTGADISLIKLSCLSDDTLVDDNNKIKLQGISDRTIETIGRTVLTLHFGNFIKECFFHVVPEDFVLRADGVIGRDLLVNLKASIDYGDRLLRIGLNKVPYVNQNTKLNQNLRLLCR